MMKKKLFIFFSVVLVVFISLPLFNYHVDIARVFSKSYDKHYKGQLPNELFLQSQFLMEHPEYTKILFGSSRIGNGIDLTQYDGWYKAWHQGANFEEHLNTLKYILKEGKKVDEIVVAVDYLSFFSKASRSDYFRQNPPMSLEESLEFYNFYLFRKPTKKDFKHFIQKDLIPKRKHIFSNEAQSHSRDNNYFINQAMFMDSRQVSHNIFYANIQALEKIKQLCESNGIKFSFFINPFHYKNYYGQDIDFVLKYKQELAKIDYYYDCSLDINKYTTDSKYWVDVSHYNKVLGDLILDDVFLEKNNLCKKIALNNVENVNKKFIKENLEKLVSLSWSDLKIIPHTNYVKKKLLSKKINKSQMKYNLNLKEISSSVSASNMMFLKIDVIIHQPTQIKFLLNEQTSQQVLREFNGWPKVGKDHMLGITLKCADLKDAILQIQTTKNIKFKKIEVFELKDFK